MRDRLQQRMEMERRCAEIAAMRAEGRTLREIAAHVGVSTSRIGQLALSAPRTAEQIAARERFPGLMLDLAVRLAQRFPDAAAVSEADDEELISMRLMGAAQFRMLRAQYPRREKRSDQ